jgi:hypothetical protein
LVLIDMLTKESRPRLPGALHSLIGLLDGVDSPLIDPGRYSALLERIQLFLGDVMRLNDILQIFRGKVI